MFTRRWNLFEKFEVKNHVKIQKLFNKFMFLTFSHALFIISKVAKPKTGGFWRFKSHYKTKIFRRFNARSVILDRHFVCCHCLAYPDAILVSVFNSRHPLEANFARFRRCSQDAQNGFLALRCVILSLTTAFFSLKCRKLSSSLALRCLAKNIFASQFCRV